MNIQLSGKLHYLKGKKGHSIYYHFTNQFGGRERISLGITIDKPAKNNKGEFIFPAEANDIALQIDSEVRSRLWKTIKPGETEKITLQKAFDQFLEMKRPNIAPKTIQLHELSFKKLKEYFHDIPVESIDHKAMLKFRSHIIEQDKIENASWWLRHLSAFFNYCADPDINIIQRSPLTKSIKIKSPEKPIVIFSDEELQNLYDYISEEHGIDAYNQFRFLELTGWRVSDSCILKTTNIDNRRNIIQQYITKSKRFRDYPMDEELSKFLRHLPSFGDYVFKYRSVHSLDHFFHDAVKEVLPDKLNQVSVHTLRKQFTYNCYRNGVPVEDCGRLLGHTSITTTLKYYHYWDTNLLRKSLEKSRIRGKAWQKNGKKIKRQKLRLL